MQLKNVIDMPCGLRFMLDELQLQSGYARRFLLDSHMMTSSEQLLVSYEVLKQFSAFVNSIDKSRLNTLLFRLQGVKDINTTINNLSRKAVLDDIELFEIKHLAILAGEVKKIMQEYNLNQVIEISELNNVIDILDPDGLKIASFYIYDSYCEELKQLRSDMRKNPDQQEQLLIEATELEDGVRASLSEKLYPFVENLSQALISLALIDINVAKALQISSMALSFPNVAATGECRYQAMFNPQVKASLEKQGREFQPVNIDFGSSPSLITGANMGGKTVVLKTLALCQMLFQFGFGIPASSATIVPCDEIFFCIGDEQSIEKGLSSFAAEMKKIDAVIKASRTNNIILALIDEPARTTNPTEGTALVQALLKVINGNNVRLVMTTHYDIEPGNAHCLRVKGLVNGLMDYSLVEVHDGDVPHEALNIAQSLNIDSEWLNEARRLLGDGSSCEESKPNNVTI